MGLPRSTYYDAPAMEADEAQIVAALPRSAMNSRPMATDGSVPSSATGGLWSTPRRSAG
jgi:hypothetical protein